jgi:hypothetical protein
MHLGFDGLASVYRRGVAQDLQYPNIVDTYEKFVKSPDAKEPKTMKEGDVLEHSAQQHLFSNIITWLAAHKISLDPSPYEAGGWDVPTSFGMESVQKVRDWFVSGIFPTAIFKQYWLPFKSKLVNSFFGSTDAFSTMTMEGSKAEGTVDVNYFPFLVPANLAQMSAEVLEANGNPALSNCEKVLPPHVRRSIYLRDFLAKSCDKCPGEAVPYDSIQNTSGEPHAMVCEDLLSMIHLYTLVRTGMMTGAAVHTWFFVQGNAFVYPHHPGLSKQEAENERGIKNIPIQMLETLEIVLESLGDMMTANKIIDLDSKGYNLKRSISHFTAWANQLKSFFTGCRYHLVYSAGNELKIMAAALDACLPRWEFVFAAEGDTFAEDLAKERVLNHPKRPVINPLTKAIKATKAMLNNIAKDWNLLKLLESSDTYISSTITTSERYMLVVAALTTVMFHRRTPKAQQQAEEILTFAAKMQKLDPAFSLPVPLRMILKAMADGVDKPDTPAPPAKVEVKTPPAIEDVAAAAVVAAVNPPASAAACGADVKEEEEEEVANQGEQPRKRARRATGGGRSRGRGSTSFH